MNRPSQGGSLLLLNARVVLPEEVSDSITVLIENGLIKRIATSSSAESLHDVRELDLSGLVLFPGFIDVHIHGAVGVDTMDASPDDLLCVSKFLATQGVTGWLPTLVPSPDESYTKAISAIEIAMTEQELPPRSWEGSTGPGQGARVLGVHYEGPFVNSAQCGALRSEYFKSYGGPADLKGLKSPRDERALKMITLAPELEGGLELVRDLVRRDWVVSVGHTRAGVDMLDRAFSAGARHMTHFMNAMPPLHHRAPGPVGWGLTRDDVTCDVIADGIHLDPLVMQLLLRTKGADRLTLISDAIAAAGKGDGAYEIWGETIHVKDGRTSNARGSIAGSVITMIDAVRMMLSLGAREVEVARMASTNPARLLRLDGECGSIEEGKRADLVALDNQGNVCLTMVGGSIAFQRE